MNYKTKYFEIEAFQFYFDNMPDWFMGKVSSNDVILFNSNDSKYGVDRAFCIINAKNSSKRDVVSAGEVILNLEYGELMKMHPDNFYTKYEKL